MLLQDGENHILVGSGNELTRECVGGFCIMINTADDWRVVDASPGEQTICPSRSGKNE